jgi:alcohol dehydrogenase YqhD (iron-dependent ADH family)
MLDGIFNNSTKIIFGKNSLDCLWKEIRNYSSKILLVYGKNSIKQNGIYKKIIKQLSKYSIDFIELNNIQSNPTTDKVYEGIELCRKHNIDFVLAVGGGSVIDTAKFITVGVTTKDFYDDIIKNNNPQIPLTLGVILTIPGSGSESNAGAVITNVGKQEKIGYTHENMRPKFAIMNPEFTFSLSLKQTACGVLDAISHVFERFFAKNYLDYTKCTEELCLGLLKTLLWYYPNSKTDLNDYGIRSEIMLACKYAHDNTVGFGRKQDWASHAISHEISVYYPEVSHGNLVFIIFLAWLEYVNKLNDNKDYLINVLEKKFYCEDFKSLIIKFKNLLVENNLFTNLYEIDNMIYKKFIKMSIKCCCKNQSSTIGNYVKLMDQDIQNILYIAYRGEYN